MDKPVIIFGAKGIAKSALEILQSNDIIVFGFLDEDKTTHDQTINDIPVLGAPDDHGFLKLIGYNHRSRTDTRPGFDSDP